MNIINIFENILNYIKRFFNYIFYIDPKGYCPLNFSNINFIAFILGISLFFMENFIIIFARSISELINTFNPISIAHFDIYKFIDFKLFILISLIINFINIFFIQNLIKTLIILGIITGIFFSKNIVLSILRFFTIDIRSAYINIAK